MDKIYKREDFEIVKSMKRNDYWVTLTNGYCLDNKQTVRHYVPQFEDKYYFPSKIEAGRAIRIFLDKQNKTDEERKIADLNCSKDNWSLINHGVVKTIKVVLNEGDKLTVERKIEKVFSIEAYLADCNVPIIAMARYIRSGELKKWEGETAKTLRENGIEVKSWWMIDPIK